MELGDALHAEAKAVRSITIRLKIFFPTKWSPVKNAAELVDAPFARVVAGFDSRASPDLPAEEHGRR
jgi:hypothetical protein